VQVLKCAFGVDSMIVKSKADDAVRHDRSYDPCGSPVDDLILLHVLLCIGQTGGVVCDGLSGDDPYRAGIVPICNIVPVANAGDGALAGNAKPGDAEMYGDVPWEVWKIGGIHGVGLYTVFRGTIAPGYKGEGGEVNTVCKNQCVRIVARVDGELQSGSRKLIVIFFGGEEVEPGSRDTPMVSPAGAYKDCVACLQRPDGEQGVRQYPNVYGMGRREQMMCKRIIDPRVDVIGSRAMKYNVCTAMFVYPAVGDGIAFGCDGPFVDPIGGRIKIINTIDVA